MRKFDKVLLFVFSIICFGGSLCTLSLFYNLPLITDAVKGLLIAYPWLNYAFIIYNLLTCLCFFLLMLFLILSPSKESTMVLKRDSGKLQFSSHTIESAVRYSYAEFEEINFSKVKAKINKNPEKTRIFVKFSMKDPSNLIDLTSTIQEKIEASMKASFGITINSINLKVVEVGPSKADNDEQNKGVRVI